jgi:hypothetical protein
VKTFSHSALLASVNADIGSFVGPDIPCDKTDPTAAVHSVACRILLDTLLKKWRSESEAAETRALLTFLEANHLSERWSPPPDRFSDPVIGEIKRELDNFLHPEGEELVQSFEDILDEGQTGPGSSIGAAGQSFYAKLGCSLLTATSAELYDMYSAYVSRFPLWSEAESLRKDTMGIVNVVDGSNVAFAPKNADTARLICTEPSLNMFFQLGLKNLLERRLAQRWNVDFENQPEVNRILALVGSRDGNFATIDLSSASDLISVTLCETLLPKWFFELLMALRSPKVRCRVYGLERDLGMISTMGNGFTFPLMTVILSCTVRAVYKVLGIPIRDNPRTEKLGEGIRMKVRTVPGNWAVFGDDIIVCSEAYDLMVSTLHRLGLQVNLSKSFSTGPFRESCGHDYFRGLNVRGVYLKKVTSPQDIVVAVNLLNDWTARVGIPLRSTVRYLVSLLEGHEVKYVPYADPADAGIRVPSSFFRGTVDENGSVAYRSYVSRSKKVTIGDGRIYTPKGHKRMFYNPAMALLAFLRGEVRNGHISIRQTSNGNLYRTRWHVTPNWDYMPRSMWVNPRVDWQRFTSAVSVNMTETEE